MNLSASSKITVGAGAGAGTSTVNSPTIDMAGWDSCLFIATFATPAANNTVKVAQASVAAMTGEQDLAGSAVVVGASDETVWVEIHKPRKRYIRAKFLRGTSSALGDIVCVQSGPAAEPVTNALAGTSAGHLIVSPAEGTA